MRSPLGYKIVFLISQICNSLVHMMGMILIDDVVQVGGVIGANQIMVDAHVKKYLHNIHTQTAVKGRGMCCVQLYCSTVGRCYCMVPHYGSTVWVYKLYNLNCFDYSELLSDNYNASSVIFLSDLCLLSF